MKNRKELACIFSISFFLLIPFADFAQGIEIQSGGVIAISGNASIEINNGNLVNNGTYTKGTETVTFSGTVTDTISGSSNTAFNNLAVTNTGGTNLLTGTAVTVTNLTTTGGILVVNSDATTSGSLIVTGTASGNVTTESYLSETGKWHVVSSPVSAQNIWSFATLAGNSIVHKDNGSGSEKYAVTDYLEASNTWDSNYPIADTEGSFAAGSGYSVLRSAPGVVSYTGTINTSDVSKPLTRTLYGWNALGNPYTSAINATAAADVTNNLITANTDNFDPSFAALYLWDAANDQYVIINNSGDLPTGTLAQDYIQAGQGFFVRAKDNTGLTFSITEAMQTHQTTVPLKSGETAWPTIQLAVESSSKRSSTLLAFNDRMTNGLDITYDAGMFKSDKNFALYSRLVDDNGVDFAIQALPQDYENLVIQLGIDVPAGTEITFAAETMNLPADAVVWLEDRSTATFTRLDETDASYSTMISESTTGVGNFFIHTKYSVTAADVTETANAYRVLVNHNQGYLRILTSETNPGQARVYDVAGRLMGALELQANGENKLYLNSRPGVYLVQVSGGKAPFTEKVVWN